MTCPKCGIRITPQEISSQTINKNLLNACKDGLYIAYEAGLNDSDAVIKRLKKAIKNAEGGEK